MFDFGFNQGTTYLLRQGMQEDLTGVDFYVQLGGNNETIVGTDPVFTRTSAAYGESSGTVLSKASGEMRNLTKGRRGVLIETAHLGNLCLYPKDYSNAYWEKGSRLNLAAFDNEHVLPDGTIGTNVEIKEGSETGTYFIRTGSPVMDASTLYFKSVFCHQGNTDIVARNAAIAFHGEPAWFGDYTVVSLVFETGEVLETTAGTPTLGSPVKEKGAVELNDGWWLLWAIALTGSDTVTANQNRHLVEMTKLNGDISPDGNETSSILACWPQLIKADGFRTSDILNQTDTVIPHTTESMYFAGSNYKQAYGCLQLKFYVDGVYPAAANRMIYSAENATDHIKAYLDTSGDFVCEIVTGGVTRTLTTAQAITAGEHSFCINFGNETPTTSDLAYLDGSVLALTTDVNTTAAPATVDNIYIGCDSTGKELNGTVQIVRTWASRKTEAEVRFYSGGYAWLPNEATATNELWFDAEQLDLADGAGVSTWPDLSGNSRDMTVGAYTAPFFRLTGGPNSKPTVEFKATGTPATSLQAGTFTLIAQPTHKFIVIKNRSFAAARKFYDCLSTGPDILQQGSASPNVVVNAGSASADIDTVTLGEFHLIEVVNNGASSSIVVDNNDPVEIDAGTNGMDSFTLNALFNRTLGSNIDVSEVAVYSSELTGDDLTNIRSYIRNKYGIQTQT